MLKALFSLLLALFAGIPTARAWNDDGHMIVARIAFDRLTTAQQRKVQAAMALLRGPNDEPAGDYTAITAAVWMDDIKRGLRFKEWKRFAPWHYVEIDVEPAAAALPTPGPDGNIVTALQHCVQAWREPGPERRFTREEALAMILHLVGDLHQPLHASGHRDAGGNGLAVSNLPLETYQNLHTFWDRAFEMEYHPQTGTVEAAYHLGRAAGEPAEISRLAAQFSAAFPPPAGWDRGGTDFAAWALESHALGRQAYLDLPGGLAAREVALGADYVEKARTLARQRLVLAGFRLAALLQSML